MGAIFSFRSIDQTIIIQVISVVGRFTSIAFFICGSLFLIFRDGIKDIVPKGLGVFNLHFFVDLFSNSVYSLMLHHSLPNIIADLSKSDAKFAIKYSFIISSVILFVIPITAVMAFG
jgi:hypothetical protein